jgi:putative PEP-CTERM system TPR-repeat lipoprotein
LCLILLTSAAGAQGDGPLEAARSFRTQGELPSAVLTLKEHLQHHNDDAEARALLGRVYLDFGQGAAAEQELTRAMSLGVPRAEIAPTLARALLAQGDAARALDAASFDDSVTETPLQAELLAIQGAAHLLMDDRQAAGQALAQALQRDPQHEAALIEQARLTLTTGDPEGARRLLGQALEAHPGSAQVLSALAELAMQQGRLDDAEALLTTALSDGAPSRWMLLYKRANARIALDDLNGAASDIEAGEKLYPAFLGYDFARGRLGYEQGAYAAALSHLQIFLRANPREPSANLYAGAAALKLGQLEQAQEYLSTHLAAVPDSRQGRLLLAATQVEQEAFGAAEETLQPLLATDPPDARALKALAVVAQRQGRAEEARRLYGEYLAAVPDDDEARMQLAALLAAADDIAGSEQAVQAILERAPDNLSARLQQLQNAIVRQDTARALALGEALAAAHPASPRALSGYAAALAAGGDIDKAREQLEKAWELDPTFNDAAFKLARMASMAGDHETARGYYEAILANDPDNTAAILSMAQRDVFTGEPAAGLQRLEAALKAQPDAVDLRLNLANGYLQTDRADEALRLLQAAPSAVAEEPAMLAATAKLELAMGQPFGAMSRAEELVEDRPDSAEARYLLARALTAANIITDVLPQVLEGFRIDPDHPDAGEALATVFAAADDDRRTALLEGMRDVHPKHRQTQLMEVRLLRAQGETAGAINLLQRLHEAEPDDAQYYELLLQAQVRGAKRQEAIKTAEAWLREHPDDIASRTRLAQLYAEDGREAEAIAAYEAVLKEDPEHVAALNNLAQLRLAQDRPSAALALAERAHAAAPNNPAVADTLGMALLATGDAAAALAPLAQAHQALPGNVDIALHYARALVAAEQPEQARALLLPLQSADSARAEEIGGLLRELE